jgi:hypothetical protein
VADGFAANDDSDPTQQPGSPNPFEIVWIRVWCAFYWPWRIANCASHDVVSAARLSSQQVLFASYYIEWTGI